MNIIQELKKKIDEKNNVLKYAKKFLDATKDIIVFFFKKKQKILLFFFLKKKQKILLFFLKKGTFSYKGNVFKTKEEKSEDESEEESEKNKLEKIKDNY